MNIRSLILIVLSITFAGCTTSPSESYVDDYQRAQKQLAGTSEPASLDAFLALYTHLTGPDVGDRVRAAYAEAFFFNDTLHTARAVSELAAYMEETAARVDSVAVEIQDHWQQGENVYVRWTMNTAFTVAGKQRETRSVGITHLRFDEHGKIILHQDFWDSTEGFYRHMPVSGHAINWIRGKL